VLRADEGVMPRRLLLHYLNQFDYRGSANGTTRLKLTQGAMKQIPVVVPPSDEQRQILQTLDAQLSRLEATLAATDRVEAQCAALRRSLLHAAFKGKLTEEWRETAGV
jgi:type I restriction enzyme S subunit